MTLTAVVLVMDRVARSSESFYFERQPALVIAGLFYVALWSAAMIAAACGWAEFKGKLPESKPPGYWLLVEVVVRFLLLAISGLPIPMVSICNLITWTAVNVVMACALRLEVPWRTVFVLQAALGAFVCYVSLARPDGNVVLALVSYVLSSVIISLLVLASVIVDFRRHTASSGIHWVGVVLHLLITLVPALMMGAIGLAFRHAGG
jgi:hypothetical protein